MTQREVNGEKDIWNPLGVDGIPGQTVTWGAVSCADNRGLARAVKKRLECCELRLAEVTAP